MKTFKLKTILFFYLTLWLALSITAVGVLSYNSFAKVMVEHFALSRVDVLEQVSARLSEMERILRTTSNIYFQDERLLKTLCESPDDIWASGELGRMKELCDVIGSTSGFPHACIFAMKNGFTYTSDAAFPALTYSDYASRIWFAEVAKESSGSVVFTSFTDEDKTHFYIAAARSVQNDSGEISGICLIFLDEEVISALYRPLLGDNSIYVVDKKGRIVSHSDPYMPGFNYYDMNMFSRIFGSLPYVRTEKSGVPYLFSRYQNDSLGWSVVEEVPLNSILSPLVVVKTGIVAVSVLALAIGAALILIIARKTTSPLTKLCVQFGRVGEYGGAPVFFSVRGWNEINTICDECNQMVSRIDLLVKDVQSREREKRKAELDILLLQIHPHLIFNTLFSIRCLMEMGNMDAAVKMQTSFIALMRNILETDREFISISEELRILEQYALLQKHRFGDRFDLIIACPDELSGHKILRLLLQPLVENAILHGVASSEHRGCIEVRLKAVGDDVEAVVADNGVGMDADTIARILSESKGGGHIGVANVRGRLRLYFGEAYRLDIDSAPGKGTRLSLAFPQLT